MIGTHAAIVGEDDEPPPPSYEPDLLATWRHWTGTHEPHLANPDLTQIHWQMGAWWTVCVDCPPNDNTLREHRP